MTRTLEILDRLIAFPTVSKDSNLALIAWAQTLLQDAGFTVTQIPSPCGTKAGLFARIGPDGAGGICLSAHTDVVPTAGQNWTKDPFKLTQDETYVFGRGTTDMKGFLASGLALAERARHLDLSKPLSLALSYDEEVGCVGIKEMLPKLTPLIGKPRLVIVGEPTSMQVALGHKGKTALTAIIRGEAGHSALAPQFVNAIHVAARFVAELQAVQDHLASGAQDAAYSVPYSTVHVGTISGGEALNMVPEQVEMRLEFRHLPEVPPQDILDAINAAAVRAEAAFDRPGFISITPANGYPGLGPVADEQAIAAARRLAGQGAPTKVAFGTEAGFFASLGLNTVVIGPGEMATDGHQPDESLSLDQLSQCDAMMERIGAALSAP